MGYKSNSNSHLPTIAYTLSAKSNRNNLTVLNSMTIKVYMLFPSVHLSSNTDLEAFNLWTSCKAF